MKALGIVRHIDDLGRVVIPMEVRKTQGWKSGQKIEMFMSEEGLLLSPYRGKEEKENALKILKRAEKFISGGPDTELLSELQDVIEYLESK